MRATAKSTSSTAETRLSASASSKAAAVRYSKPVERLGSVLGAAVGCRQGVTPEAAAAPRPARTTRRSGPSAITAGRVSARGNCPADIGAALGDAGFLEAHPREGRDAFADHVFRWQREAEAQVGFRGVRAARPFGTGVEDNSCPGGGRDQLGHVDAVGQFEPEKNPAFRLPH